MSPDIFLDKLNLVLENRFREFCHGAVERIDWNDVGRFELVADEILFETDIVADTPSNQYVVFDTGNVGDSITAVTPTTDTTFRERRLVNGHEIRVHFSDRLSTA